MDYLVKVTHDLPDDNERFAILSYTSSTLINSGIVDDMLTDMAGSFTDLGSKLSAAHLKEGKNPLTSAIKLYHKTRLTCITSMHSGIEFYSTHEAPSLRQAGESLAELYERHFLNLPDKKRVTYTHAIQNFLEDVSDPLYVTTLDELNMSEKVALLSSSQAEFLSLTIQRAQDEELDDTPHVTTIRKEIHDVYDVLERHLFYKQYKGYDGYEELTKKLNGSIGEILTVAKSRHTHENSEHEIVNAEESDETTEVLEDIHDQLHEESLDEGDE